jgi:hypothetical protein
MFRSALIATACFALAACSDDHPLKTKQAPQVVDAADSKSVSTAPSQQAKGCCVLNPDTTAVRNALLSEIAGMQSMKGDTDYIPENSDLIAAARESTIPQMEEIVVEERIAFDRHTRREYCDEETTAECKYEMRGIYSEDYPMGFCLTMIDPQKCITTAAFDAANPPDVSIKDPNERKAAELAARAYR